MTGNGEKVECRCGTVYDPARTRYCCPKCGLMADPGSVRKRQPQTRGKTNGPDQKDYLERSAGWRRERNRKMASNLRLSGGKWGAALEGQRFASFSLLGTESWEDYASAAMIAMQLETISDLGQSVESIEQRIIGIHDLLAEIRDLIREGLSPNGTGAVLPGDPPIDLDDGPT